MKSIIIHKQNYDKSKPLISKIPKADITKNTTNPHFASTKAPKRDKLKNLLILKYMKMFGLVEENKILNDEVSRFFNKDKVNDNDLKKLEKNLSIIFNNKIVDRIRNEPTLTQNNANSSTLEIKRDVLPPIDNKAAISRSMVVNDDDIDIDDFLDDKSKKKEILKHGDEWDKIISYNKKMAEIEKKNRIRKSADLKVKTKHQLDEQINLKMARQQEEVQEKTMYFNYVMKDVEKYHKTEKAKENLMKSKILKEKEIRDKQLKEEKTRKKIQSANELAYDLKLLQEQLDKIEHEKKMAQEKKQREKEAYNRIQLDNIEFKKYQLEMKRKEKESDIAAQEEYSRILDKQEKARADYFKNCASRQSEFMSKMAENVVKVNDDKLAKLDADIINYQNKRDQNELMEEERRKKKQFDQKVETRKFLDMQMDYKKHEGDEDMRKSMQYDKYLEDDTKNFNENEREKMLKVIIYLYFNY